MPGISFHKTVTKNTFSEAPIPNFSNVFPNFFGNSLDIFAEAQTPI